LRKVGDLAKIEKKFRDGKKWYVATYEYANKVPLRDAEDTIYVNFVDCGVHSYVTDYTLERGNCVELATFGRRRWKSENEGNNELTNNGYHLKHNFGHREQNLSHNFVLLNLIAFMMHVILAYVNQEGYGALRRGTDTLYGCFERIRGIFLLVTCQSWEQFYQLTIEGVDLDSS
jgi:hypothetical protein